MGGADAPLASGKGCMMAVRDDIEFARGVAAMRDREASARFRREAAAAGRHFPSGHFTDVTGGQGGPTRHQCGGCEAPITHERGEWRSVYTKSMWCPEGAR
jgi:hypothetical protein